MPISTMISVPRQVFLCSVTLLVTCSVLTTAFVPRNHHYRRNRWQVQQYQHFNYIHTRLFETTKKDSFDMEELRQRIRAEQIKPVSAMLHQFQESLLNNIRKNAPSHVPQQIQQQQQPLESVYIVSFQKQGSINSSNSKNSIHGVHSIEYPKGSGNNVVLAFTNEASCNKFAQSLRAQRFFQATTQKLSIEALVDFCLNVGVMMQLIPDGIDIIPPKQNVSKFGLQNNNDHSNNNSNGYDNNQQSRSRQQQTYKELNNAYYMLDETDDFDDEGILMDHIKSSTTGSTDQPLAVGVFE